MKTILVLCLAFAVAYPAQGLFLSTITGAINTVTNVISSGIDSVVTTTQNTIDSINSVINAAQFVGQIIWDNALDPALQLALQNGAIWVDDYFGGLLNAIGKKRESELRIELSLVQSVFAATAVDLIAKFKVLFDQFVAEAISVVTSSILALILGTTTINDILGKILDKLTGYAAIAVTQAVETLTVTLHGLGEEVSQVVIFLEQTFLGLGSTFEAELNALGSIIINAVNLALQFLTYNFAELVDYVRAKAQQFYDEAIQLLMSSLLGLLLGSVTINDIFDKLLDKLVLYIAQTVQFAFVYASTYLVELYTQFQPQITAVLGFIDDFFATTNLVLPGFITVGLSLIQPTIDNFLTLINP